MPISLSDLPTVNAGLNLTSAVLLVVGYAMIRTGRKALHARFMVAAFVTSVLFLISYLTYHFHQMATHYEGSGALRVVYFAVLISHVVLAVTVPPLALRTLYLAWRKRWASHRRWARWTLPIWLYVSVTGVVVYLMLYVLPA